jgi:hypothetical protein
MLNAAGSAHARHAVFIALRMQWCERRSLARDLIGVRT